MWSVRPRQPGCQAHASPPCAHAPRHAIPCPRRLLRGGGTAIAAPVAHRTGPDGAWVTETGSRGRGRTRARRPCADLDSAEGWMDRPTRAAAHGCDLRTAPRESKFSTDELVINPECFRSVATSHHKAGSSAHPVSLSTASSRVPKLTLGTRTLAACSRSPPTPGPRPSAATAGYTR